MEMKNKDYGADSDPFRNFREFGLLGILVRLSDKLARLRTFTERGELSVKDESVTDTIIDARNYLVLFEGFRRDLDHGDPSLEPADDRTSFPSGEAGQCAPPSSYEWGV